jgi:hypothetical protein
MRRPAAAIALSLVLAVAGLVVSRPLVQEWRAGLPVTARAPVDVPVLARTPGDVLQLYYQLWLFGDGLLGRAPLFRDPYQFRVDGPRWNLPQTFPPLSIPFTLLSPLGHHAAYNLLVWLSFPFAGLAAYGLARQLGATPWGAVVGGLGFALVPARLGPLFGGQPAGFAAGLVPLCLWGLDLALVEGRMAGALGGGGALLALATLEPHYVYLVGGLLLVYAPIRAVTIRSRPRLGPLVVFAALAALGAGWVLMLRQAFVVGSIADAGRSLDEVRLFSPGPGTLRLPASYGGVVLGALAVRGLIRSRRPADGHLRLLFGGTLALGILLSLGPTMPGLPLYQVFHRFVPLFDMIRNPEKFRILTSLSVSLLAAFGADAARQRLRAPWSALAALALAGLVLVETPPWHPIAVARFPDNPVYASLRREAGKVLYLPVWPGDSAWSSVYLYTVTRTQVPTINGYSPLVPRNYVRDVAGALQGMNVGDLGPTEVRRLHDLGVTHVVVDRAVFPAQVSPFPSAFTLRRLETSSALVLERVADPLWMFRVTGRSAPVPRLPTSPVGVFYEAEALSRETGTTAAEPAASGGAFVQARPGVDRAGFLTFGPYRYFPAGAYRATFRVRGAGLSAEVTIDQGRTVLAARSAPPSVGWADADVAFDLPRAAPIELRLHWAGDAEAAADWALVVFRDRPQPEWSFTIAELPHRLGERPDTAATGGIAGHADAGESLRTDLLTGPARLYPSGSYRLWLRARLTAPVAGPALRLAVTEPMGRILAERTVDGSELPGTAYGEVGLDFTLGTASVLEFPVGYLGRAGVDFDRLRLVPRP